MRRRASRKKAMLGMRGRSAGIVREGLGVLFERVIWVCKRGDVVLLYTLSLPAYLRASWSCPHGNGRASHHPKPTPRY